VTDNEGQLSGLIFSYLVCFHCLATVYESAAPPLSYLGPDPDSDAAPTEIAD